jgi:uncharacterized protein YkwD
MLSLNWVDYLILAVLIIYGYVGYSGGFIRAILDLVNFGFSFMFGLRFHGFFASVLMEKFSLPQGFSNAIGFFLVTLFSEIIFGILISKFLSSDSSLLGNRTIFKKFNEMLGILPGILSGTILITFILIMLISLPTATPVKRVISSSKISNFLLTNSQGWEKQLKNVFGGAINETINFLTVEPKDTEIVQLNYKVKNPLQDSASEQSMFKLVNKERVSRGLREVVFDTELREVGRRHCGDMFKRGYFSHFTPEGFSPFDRIGEAGILYEFAGENLALSPDVNIAMRGLMNSPGHKANILSVNFGRVGIGVIDGGIYGEMFCQEFTN